MTCAELHDAVAELALGVLTGRERAAAVAHLDKCEACREDVRQLMTAADQLPGLLPLAEPPAGFETLVLERLAIARNGAWPGAGQPGSGRRSGGRAASVTGTRPGESRLPGRARRALAVAAMGLAVIAASLGGWRVTVGTQPSTNTAAAPLTSAILLSATHRNVGSVFLSSGTPRWLYMHVDIGTGNETVTCQVMSADGQASTIGSFRLANGHGDWGSPAPGNAGTLTGARLLSANGTVLAAAAFRH